MGYFTWTDARRQNPRLARNGNYYARDTIGYGSPAMIVCPDNTVIKESCYDGYGMFGDKDVYDLVVDWNKSHLEQIFNDLISKYGNIWGQHLQSLAVAYQNDDETALNAEINKLAGTTEPEHFKDEWKRIIGIAIACEHNEDLPFPIKIIRSTRPVPYNKLYPSISCQ